jgi:hypothetical protein
MAADHVIARDAVIRQTSYPPLPLEAAQRESAGTPDGLEADPLGVLRSKVIANGCP